MNCRKSVLHIITLLLLSLSHIIEVLSEKASTEHAQFEHSNQTVVESLQQERDDLQSHLQQRLQENKQLTK